VAVSPDVGLLKPPSSGLRTGQAWGLLHVMGSSYGEESKRASAGYRQDQEVRRTALDSAEKSGLNPRTCAPGRAKPTAYPHAKCADALL
jgi:hypothetical protein